MKFTRFEEEIGLSNSTSGSSSGKSTNRGKGRNRMSYRGNYNSTPRRNSFNDGQTDVKRKRPNRYRGNRSGDQRRGGSFDIDAPLFKAPYPPDRSPNARAQGQRFQNDDRYDRNGDMYNYDDSYDDASFRRPIANPGRSARSGGRPSPQFEKKTMHQFVDSQHAGPSWNWDNYFNECNNWQDKHKLAYYKSRCMALEFENQMLFEQVKTIINENSVFAKERGELPSMLLPNFPGGLRGFEKIDESALGSGNKGKDRKTSVDSTSDENLIFDVPDSMIDVIEKRMRHKLQLHKERKEEAAKEKKLEEEEKIKNAKGGPQEPRGFKRKGELEKLYGPNAAVIQNLETSIQYNFNRNCDTHKPELWMAVPLNPQEVV